MGGITDYEAAWVRLAAYVASKSQHGRQDLLVTMAELAEEERLPAGELDRLFRLHGVELARARATHQEIPGEAATFDGGTPSPADPDLPGHHDRGGHDGSSSDAAGHGLAAGRAG